jgi:hypothetical protein
LHGYFIQFICCEGREDLGYVVLGDGLCGYVVLSFEFWVMGYVVLGFGLCGFGFWVLGFG